MRHRILVAIGLLTVVASAPLIAQSKWTPPRTPDGQPDLQGVWNFSTITPLERPAEFAAKPFLTDEEAKDYERRTMERSNRDNRDQNRRSRRRRRLQRILVGPGRPRGEGQRQDADLADRRSRRTARFRR